VLWICFELSSLVLSYGFVGIIFPCSVLLFFGYYVLIRCIMLLMVLSTLVLSYNFTVTQYYFKDNNLTYIKGRLLFLFLFVYSLQE
jgi:hypothetical protein